MNHFAPGQRWVSETEPELGLGTILGSDGRFINVVFMASGETRRYALNSAPLARVDLVPGQQIRSTAGAQLTVAGYREQDGLRVYQCLGEEQTEQELPETDLAFDLELHGPRDRLLAARPDRNNRFYLRYQAQQARARELASPLRGLLGARIQPLPHQMYVAREVADRHAPRVLLADEVGLGKTIEAGLVIHRRLITGRSARVLVVVPQALQHQWLVELLRRFHLRFSLFDEARCSALEEGNPFEESQLGILPLELCGARSDIFEQALAAGWDLLVVDEAHRLAWTPDSPSPEYLHIQALAERTPSVLLLTATPEQLGRSGHFARLRLLDPHRFHDLSAFEAEQQGYASLAEQIAPLLEQTPLDAQTIAVLRERLGDEEVLPLLAKGEEQAARTALLNRLLDRHGTGRVMFRNTRTAVGGFPERICEPQALESPADYSAGLFPERGHSGDSPWWRLDPRVDSLAKLADTYKPEKILVICKADETARELQSALKDRFGLAAGLFHRGQSIVDQDRAAAWFADPQGARLLVCSEIGSEGRNFQFAHHLFLFDLPQDPDLLEQRIGRLDRIGQQGQVRIHVPYFAGTRQESWFRWLNESLNAFAAPNPAAPAVFADLAEEIEQALDEPTLLGDLIAHTRTREAELREQLRHGRDRLLELHSCRREPAEALTLAVREEDAKPGLSEFLERACDELGVDVVERADGALLLRPGAHMSTGALPGLGEDGLPACLSRDEAMAREDLAFLTWEHPLIGGMMDAMADGDFGNAALVALRRSGLPPGQLLLEAIYIAECPAPRGLGVADYLPGTPVRLLIGPNGGDLATNIAPDRLNAACEEVEPTSVQAVVRAINRDLRKRFQRAEALADERLGVLRDKAMALAEERERLELDRLKALARVNPSVRQDEIEAQQQRMVELGQALAGARIRLDAARALVTA